ncbi:MAG: KH domain-containing protein [Armatimonadota bacterium]
MKGLLEYVVSSLVDHPERIVIRESIGQKNVAYMVLVDPEDVGKVIGKGGRIANALRILLRAAGGLHDKVIWVDFNRQGF